MIIRAAALTSLVSSIAFVAACASADEPLSFGAEALSAEGGYGYEMIDEAVPATAELAAPARHADLGGRLAPEAAQQAIRAQNKELAACSDLAEGPATGEVTLRFRVTEEGRVAGARVTAYTTDRAVASCAAEVMFHARFAASSGGDATVVQKLVFQAK